jgi:transposase
MIAIVTVGIDLAKEVFAVHGVDQTGKAALVGPVVRRAALFEMIAKLRPMPLVKAQDRGLQSASNR